MPLKAYLDAKNAFQNAAPKKDTLVLNYDRGVLVSELENTSHVWNISRHNAPLPNSITQ